MAHTFDVSAKTIFLRPGNGIIRRELFHGKVTEHLATEQPQVSNDRADMVVRTEEGALRHVEFQTTNEAGFGLRMLGYYYYLISAHRQHVVQTVLYMGREPMRLETGFQTPSLELRYEIINLREYDAAPLLASDDWADVALGLLAKGDPEEALAVAISRLKEMGREERAWASGTLVLLSGILGIEETVSERLREADVINVMENKVLGPLILREYEKGRDEGVQQGMRGMLMELLTEKFGALPAWAGARLQAASDEDLHTWAKRILRSTSLEDTLR
jgi:hypothetical protein